MDSQQHQLGIIMLLTPLSAAAGMSSNVNELQNNVDNIMRNTTPYDAANLYDAINIADAGGMGEREDLDVGSNDAKKELIDKNINMYDVLDYPPNGTCLHLNLQEPCPLHLK